MDKEKIIELYKREYFTPVGLCGGKPWKEVEVGGVKYTTVTNENGILFHAYFLLATAMACGVDRIKEFRAKAIETIHLLEAAPGLYNRNVGLDKMEAFDNYLGIEVISKLFKIKRFPAEILKRGKSTIPPYNFSQDGKIHLESQHQLGEIMIYKLCAGDSINPVLMGAFLAGMKLGVTSDKKSSSQALLQWIRYYLVHNSPFGGISDKMWQSFKPGFQKDFKEKWGKISKPAKRYFSDEHPLYLMLEHVDNPWCVV